MRHVNLDIIYFNVCPLGGAIEHSTASDQAGPRVMMVILQADVCAAVALY